MSQIIKRKSDFIFYTVTFVFLVALLVIVLFPIFYALIGSFKSNREILAGTNFFPEKLSLDNYIQAWTIADFKKYTFNSVYYSFFVVAASLITSSMGGYVFSRGNFPGKKVLFGIFSSTMFITLGSISIYPTLQIAKLLHINNSLWGVILVHCFGINITNIYLVRGFVNSLPKELDESAKLDGCGFFRIFWQIILPLLKPVIATIGILSFKGAWNEYLLPMVFTMGNPDQAPLPVGLVALKGSSEAAAAWNLILAGAMISIVPMMIVYLCFNKYFVKGMTTGAVKG